MNSPPVTWLEVEGYLERFENAWSENGNADVRDFFPPRDHAHYPLLVRELICVDMELGWGQPGRRVADYLDRFPELGSDPLAIDSLREQERRLVRESADADARSVANDGSMANRPSQLLPATRVLGWRDRAVASYAEYCQLRYRSSFDPGSLEHADMLAALELQGADAVGIESAISPFPSAGCEILGFRLLKELGRGAFAQVFLAEQTGLANRLVALKIGPNLCDESQTLAQLQHSHIVPIYSVHQVGDHLAVCMPYFGSTTLASVLASMRKQGGVPTVGNALWSTLHEHGSDARPDRAAAPIGAPNDAPYAALPASLEKLRNLSQVNAALWIVASLADGLAHAHERGILHRDIKPANILLADDGTPMLLDFNLSQDLRLRGGIPALFGGTLPFMAPEHLEAFQDRAKSIDARSDIYALGLVLFELLTGQHPFPVHPGKLREQVPLMLTDRLAGAPSVQKMGKAVSPAVEAIVRHCLEPDPACRYQSARALQEDIERQLDDLPLRHTPEPSLRERAGKLMRRHPRLVWAGVASVFAMLLVAVSILYVNLGRHTERVEAVNTRFEHREELRDARILLGLPFPDPIELAEGESLCRRALARYGMPDAEDWAGRIQLTALPIADQDEIRGDLGELLLLLARATWLRAGSVELSDRSRLFHEALRLNEMAERQVGSKEVRSVLLQRGLLLRLLGRNEEAAAALKRGRAIAPVTARDHYLLAGELSSQGEVTEAVRLLDEATSIEPSNAAAWAARGACLSSLKQAQPAVAAFTTCVALRPNFWRGYLWRGQALLDLQDHARAEADFDRVLQHRPGFVPALVFRALARLGRKNLVGSEADLTEAMKDANHTRLYFVRSRVRRLAGDKDGARHDYEEGMRREPADELSCIARGVARLPGDPAGALADFDQAQKLNPWSRDAAQNKAHVLAEYQGRPKDAIAVLDPLVQRYPDFTEARIGRGVLHARVGSRKDALADAVESVRRDTRPLILYQAACVYALTSKNEPSDRVEAFRLLDRAVRGGFGADLLQTDADLAPLRSFPEYRNLLDLTRRLKAT